MFDTAHRTHSRRLIGIFMSTLVNTLAFGGAQLSYHTVSYVCFDGREP